MSRVILSVDRGHASVPHVDMEAAPPQLVRAEVIIDGCVRVTEFGRGQERDRGRNWKTVYIIL